MKDADPRSKSSPADPPAPYRSWGVVRSCQVILHWKATPLASTSRGFIAIDVFGRTLPRSPAWDVGWRNDS